MRTEPSRRGVWSTVAKSVIFGGGSGLALGLLLRQLSPIAQASGALSVLVAALVYLEYSRRHLNRALEKLRDEELIFRDIARKYDEERKR